MALLETIRNKVATTWDQITRFGPLGNDTGLGIGPGEAEVPEPVAPRGVGAMGLPAQAGTSPLQPGLPAQAGTGLKGAVGTANFQGFVRDLGEYNAQFEGRVAFQIFEKMRRSDADVAAALAACKLPIRAADWQIVPGAKESEPDFALAKEICEFARENLFEGLESPTSSGSWVTQTFESVIENALLMLDFGCAAHEDLWHIDQSRVRLRKLAARLPLTFYRFHVDTDGETLLELEQLGYRGSQFVNVRVPAEKMALFIHSREGAYWYGRSILRPAYKHWWFKDQAYRIYAIAIERNSAGVPTIKQGPNASAEDRTAALTWVKNLAAHENTGLSLPNGWEMEIQGITGRILDPAAFIQHQSEMILRSVLADFLALGSTQSGSRAVGDVKRDFFLLSLEAVARNIAENISNTSIRRLVDFNYRDGDVGASRFIGTPLPYPKLVCANIPVLNVLELMAALKDLATDHVDLIQPDDDTENYLRKKTGMPIKSTVGRPRYAAIVERVQQEEQGEIPREPGVKEEKVGSPSPKASGRRAETI